MGETPIPEKTAPLGNKAPAEEKAIIAANEGSVNHGDGQQAASRARRARETAALPPPRRSRMAALLAAGQALSAARRTALRTFRRQLAEIEVGEQSFNFRRIELAHLATAQAGR